MSSTEIILISLVLVLLLVQIITLIKNNKNRISSFELVHAIKSEMSEVRKEVSGSIKENRIEVSSGLNYLADKVDHKLLFISNSLNENSKESRTEQAKVYAEFRDVFSENMNSFNALQREKLSDLNLAQEKLLRSTEKKLEEMRLTVDEKLHKTLEDRLGQSFKIVSDRLEAVQKGLGEMQHLASGVGDLKKALTNVKTRGVMGEIQLGNILEQILTPEQYDQNVKTNSSYNGQVEFAVKMPGSDLGSQIYLPIDAKFPQEDYVKLQDAYEAGDVSGIESCKKALVKAVINFAKDIQNKYLDPPNTTDFGIMFLPVEGLYAELVRVPDLLTTLQRDYKIALTGPTTLSAFLNSLQMGFRTLALQKRSSDIQKTLQAVRSQFGVFSTALKKAQDKIRQADKDIESLVTTRTNVMMKKLDRIDELDLSESNDILELEENE